MRLCDSASCLISVPAKGTKIEQVALSDLNSLLRLIVSKASYLVSPGKPIILLTVKVISRSAGICISSIAVLFE